MGNQQLRGWIKMTIKNFQDKLNKRYPNENLLLINEYKGVYSPVSIKCLTCGKEYHYSSADAACKKNKVALCYDCWKREKTKKDFINKLKLKHPCDDLTIIGFVSRNKPCTVKCNNCGHLYYYKRGSYALNRTTEYFCRDCHPGKEKIRNKKKKEFLHYINDIDSNWILSEDLNNLNDMTRTVDCICKNCGRHNYKTVYDYLRGRQCYCQTTNEPKNTKVFKECLPSGYNLLSEYQGINKQITIQHECGFCYTTKARYIWVGKGRCPHCSKKQSKGERKIKKIFDEYDIDYVSQFPITINGHHLRIDFYLCDYDIYIEYNGIQHYEPIEYFGGIDKYMKQQQLDDLKKKTLGKKLKIISYKDDITQSLHNILKFND